MNLIDPDAALKIVADQLLAEADKVLVSGSANRNRVACWLARSAFELVIFRLGLRHGLEFGQSTMRSQLACLEVAVSEAPGLTTMADYTWSRLSNACHHHAYQLDPSVVETRHLLDNVRILQLSAGRTDGQTTSSRP